MAMFESDIIYPIGIDISDHEVYVSQLKKGRKGLTISGLLHEELNGVDEDESASDDLLIAFLKQISKSKGFSGKKVAVQVVFFTFEDIEAPHGIVPF